ncbi:MAG: hypothetical protein DSY80_10680 [Desulfocapsa sp.]|nr:MAG: hypothetical protein DSY80_10680 [Desulfocapsa sp.]
MAEIRLPKNSKVTKGKTYKADEKAKADLIISKTNAEILRITSVYNDAAAKMKAHPFTVRSSVLSKALAEMTAVLNKTASGRRVWQRTASCTDVSKASSKRACASVIKLRADIDNARIAENAKRDFEKAKSALLKMPEAPKPDSLVVLIANSFDIDADQVANILAWIFAIGLELASAIGLAAALPERKKAVLTTNDPVIADLVGKPVAEKDLHSIIMGRLQGQTEIVVRLDDLAGQTGMSKSTVQRRIKAMAEVKSRSNGKGLVISVR